jgi:hypothetical protein
MRKFALPIVFFLSVLPALARPVDAPTVTAFLAACAKDKNLCADEVASLVNDAYVPDRSGDVCLSDDQLDQPGTIYISILKYLTGRREVARMKPADAIIQAAVILYPCIDTSPEPDAPDSSPAGP